VTARNDGTFNVETQVVMRRRLRCSERCFLSVSSGNPYCHEARPLGDFDAMMPRDNLVVAIDGPHDRRVPEGEYLLLDAMSAC
jgi:hypothetical protein